MSRSSPVQVSDVPLVAFYRVDATSCQAVVREEEESRVDMCVETHGTGYRLLLHIVRRLLLIGAHNRNLKHISFGMHLFEHLTQCDPGEQEAKMDVLNSIVRYGVWWGNVHASTLFVQNIHSILTDGSMTARQCIFASVFHLVQLLHSSSSHEVLDTLHILLRLPGCTPTPATRSTSRAAETELKSALPASFAFPTPKSMSMRDLQKVARRHNATIRRAMKCTHASAVASKKKKNPRRALQYLPMVRALSLKASCVPNVAALGAFERVGRKSKCVEDELRKSSSASSVSVMHRAKARAKRKASRRNNNHNGESTKEASRLDKESAMEESNWLHHMYETLVLFSCGFHERLVRKALFLCDAHTWPSLFIRSSKMMQIFEWIAIPRTFLSMDVPLWLFVVCVMTDTLRASPSFRRVSTWVRKLFWLVREDMIEECVPWVIHFLYMSTTESPFAQSSPASEARTIFDEATRAMKLLPVHVSNVNTVLRSWYRGPTTENIKLFGDDPSMTVAMRRDVLSTFEVCKWCDVRAKRVSYVPIPFLHHEGLRKMWVMMSTMMRGRIQSVLWLNRDNAHLAIRQVLKMIQHGLSEEGVLEGMRKTFRAHQDSFRVFVEPRAYILTRESAHALRRAYAPLDEKRFPLFTRKKHGHEDFLNRKRGRMAALRTTLRSKSRGAGSS